MTRSGRLDRVVILTRAPCLGEVKTRLVPPLTPDQALELHDRLTRHAVRRARGLHASREAHVEVHTDAASAQAARDWLGGGFIARCQGDGDLGDRIQAAFREGFAAGARGVVVIGSDCPRLTAAHLRHALRELSGGADVVLGPALDGGYYLVALRHQSAHVSVPALFRDVPWGTADVLARTLEIAERCGLSCVTLESLPDVDRAADLPDAEAALAADRVAPDAAVSVIIPALDDANLVGDSVASAIAAGAAEVIVVDGGSCDATRDVATAAGARVIGSARGRARQLNAGAAAASGDILLFAHADTLLPPVAAAVARETLARPGVVAGAFSFAVPPGSPHAALVGTWGRARHRLGGLPYGDQGLFVSAATFADVGGYPDIPTMEDLELASRLKRLGGVEVVPSRAITSARCWEQHGLARATLVNAMSIAAYRLGVDPGRIAGWRGSIAPEAARRR